MNSDDFFRQLRKQYKSELPFVAYRKPNESFLKAILQKDAALHLIDDYSENGFVFSQFDDSAQAILIPISNSETIKSDYVISKNSKSSYCKTVTSDEKKAFHKNLVEKAIDKIKNCELQKVVVSRAETLPLSNADPLELFKKLLHSYDTAFIYCWYHPKVGLWLGATPETLLKIEGNRLSTMALAGTQNFNGTLDVIWKSKEKEEQQFVTDFIVSSLQSSVFNLQSSETETVKAGNLLHLKTILTADLKPQTSSLKQLLKALHPTPAVCGLPKEKAKQFILENENYNREYYTGFLGELNIKNRKSRNSNRRNVENNAYAVLKTISNLYVNLRCMQLIDHSAIIYIGGGITKDSNPELEWEETVSKSEVIKSIL